ncbi:hypothetical protein Zm00014a_033929 [Zea mays]|uniref:Uncharacterized protein n=1 Tax=Zea mays TaxID=4577 RepID=A0A3L6FTQ8_MAIZE|nr:hypothetical protein Zm00014a_033929 [Zea mays]
MIITGIISQRLI